MRASDPYDVQGLLRAVARVRPDLRDVIKVARYAHSSKKAGRPLREEREHARQRAAGAPRCLRGHFIRPDDECARCA
jgi:hypothetical protein